MYRWRHATPRFLLGSGALLRAWVWCVACAPLPSKCNQCVMQLACVEVVCLGSGCHGVVQADRGACGRFRPCDGAWLVGYGCMACCMACAISVPVQTFAWGGQLVAFSSLWPLRCVCCPPACALLAVHAAGLSRGPCRGIAACPAVSDAGRCAVPHAACRRLLLCAAACPAVCMFFTPQTHLAPTKGCRHPEHGRACSSAQAWAAPGRST